MNIKGVISEIQSFSGLLPIAEKAEVKLSCLGGRYICVRGYEGTLPIDALAGRVLKLLEQCKCEFEEIEREPGRRLVKRIDGLYAETNRQFSEANRFTQTLTVLQEIVFHLFNCIFNGRHLFALGEGAMIRYHWQYGPQSSNSFEHYTGKQVQKVFGISAEIIEREGSYFLGSINVGNGRILRCSNIGPDSTTLWVLC